MDVARKSASWINYSRTTVRQHQAYARGAASEEGRFRRGAMLGEEPFIGVLFVDDEDDERSYNFQMAILATDHQGHHRRGQRNAGGAQSLSQEASGPEIRRAQRLRRRPTAADQHAGDEFVGVVIVDDGVLRARDGDPEQDLEPEVQVLLTAAAFAAMMDSVSRGVGGMKRIVAVGVTAAVMPVAEQAQVEFRSMPSAWRGLGWRRC